MQFQNLIGEEMLNLSRPQTTKRDLSGLISNQCYSKLYIFMFDSLSLSLVTITRWDLDPTPPTSLEFQTFIMAILFLIIQLPLVHVSSYPRSFKYIKFFEQRMYLACFCEYYVHNVYTVVEIWSVWCNSILNSNFLCLLGS